MVRGSVLLLLSVELFIRSCKKKSRFIVRFYYLPLGVNHFKVLIFVSTRRVCFNIVLQSFSLANLHDYFILQKS